MEYASVPYLLSLIMFIPADYSRYQAGCVPGLTQYMGPKDRTFLRAAFILCCVMVDRQSPNSWSNKWSRIGEQIELLSLGV